MYVVGIQFCLFRFIRVCYQFKLRRTKRYKADYIDLAVFTDKVYTNIFFPDPAASKRRLLESFILLICKRKDYNLFINLHITNDSYSHYKLKGKKTNTFTFFFLFYFALIVLIVNDFVFDLEITQWLSLECWWESEKQSALYRKLSHYIFEPSFVSNDMRWDLS